MKKIPQLLIILLASIVLSHCAFSGNNSWDSQVSGPLGMPEETRHLVQKLITNSKKAGNKTGLTITYPFDGTVFPPEIAAPVIVWQDAGSASKHWLIIVEFRSRLSPIYALVDKQHWMPDKTIWEIIKANSVHGAAKITVCGFDNKHAGNITAKNSISILTSKDRVDAAIFYRQVQLPFKVGKKNFKKIKWRLGDISAYEKPAVVMENLDVCASCHLFSKDGTLISMEMNYKDDSGAHFITPVAENIELSGKDFMTWNDFPKPELLPKTRGLFAKISPTGKYMVSTVHEISYAALTNDFAFCQLFFPTYGVLAWYAVDQKKFQLLPGADDYDFVQTDPSWSWDEKYIVFARAHTKNEYHKDITNIRTHIENADIHELNQRFPIQYDLYRIPFNQGQGGTPEPLQGAGRNGMSNYFPRYSPDGKWIVFTRSKTGIMLQPDSELFIIPAAGGVPRRMQCNRKLFNSWHSFAPNGKWMLFSSKANTPFTEIFLTHIDENGLDSPPVCLSRFSDDRYAANVPEFVNIEAGTIKRIVISDQ
ncbi:MAG: PD40 domain-containing protein [Desulfobacteraceae bacterium]|nr:PD40 domain-containing protein [Desulfobacteraceae bacterium]